MSRPSPLFPSLVMLIVLSGCAARSIGPTSFAPAYRSMLQTKELVVPKSCAKVGPLAVQNDLKSNVVGQRTLEGSQFPPQPIRLEGDAIAWLRAAAGEIFRKSAVPIAATGGPPVSLRLAQITMNENVHVNSGYDGRVVLDIEVGDGRGRTCWTGRKSGFAQNYGNRGTPDNYRETLDHAVDRALAALLGDDGFQNALCGRCSQ